MTRESRYDRPVPVFDGPEELTRADHHALQNQQDKIRELMRDGRWRTLDEIGHAIGAPPASVSAQLRHLRKPRFGSWRIDKRPRATRLYEYRLSASDLFQLVAPEN